MTGAFVANLFRSLDRCFLFVELRRHTHAKFTIWRDYAPFRVYNEVGLTKADRDLKVTHINLIGTNLQVRAYRRSRSGCIMFHCGI
ncbi:hypothetical protein AKG11_33120 [Shinella sp. SUS2]|nr:hypothetical protein AKG11_33120 [Shinella sp. SUS2]KOC71454.1 hypothetical protein AKG10_32985 [Shinella sp. GWS1]